MAQENHNHDCYAERDSRELNAALANYSAVEARPGLENRILSNLQAKREQVFTPSPSRWTLSLAAVIFAAVVIIVAGLAWRQRTSRTPATAHYSTIAAPVVAESARSGQQNAVAFVMEKSVSPSLKSAAKPAADPFKTASVAEAHPKLDQFPSPQPLSEQEKILVSYIENDPERAVLLARARTEELRNDESEETETFSSQGGLSNLEEGTNDTTKR